MRLSAVLLVAVFLFLPFSAFSQSYREYRSYGLSSEAREAIAKLDDDPVQHLPIPVLLGVEVSDLTKNFGDPRGGGTREHEGLDIIAPKGTPVASPTDAVVLRTGDGAGSGFYVRTANPGGETFVYMHLSDFVDNLDEGDVLKRGDIIGFVGNTGNASGGGAHLHFEIRKESATDPYPRLTKTFSEDERREGVDMALRRGGKQYASLYASLLSGAGVEADYSKADAADAELAFGETNALIIELQRFLIAAEKGEAAARLGRTGATGYFGPLTREALTEYQRASGLQATGIVDKETHVQIFALKGEGKGEEASGVATNDGLAKLLEKEFASTPVMLEIARCESRLRQFDSGGEVLRGGAGSGMIGVFQINESVHKSFAESLGMDIDSLEGNIAYAKRLYEKEGTTPWHSSRFCWDDAERDVIAGSGEFTRDLEIGMEGEDVRQLQKFLNANGFQLAGSGPGAPGEETTRFGALTRQALSRYQAANGISPSIGYFGPITRGHVALAK